MGKRVLIKISGEALSGESTKIHDINILNKISNEIITLRENNMEICIVVGGGNIYRGVEASKIGIDRVSGDYLGMLSTIINSIALQDVLEKNNIPTRVMSAIPVINICENYIRRKAQRHIEKGRVVIFAAGTGNPFVTTDTAAVLRAAEVGCDILMKATQVDGVYTKDPNIFKDTKKISNISYDEVINNNLKVMDIAAISLAKENKLPIFIFSMKNNFLEVVQNKVNCSIIE